MSKEAVNLKNKSLFSQILLLIILSAICVVLTVGVAIFLGYYNTTLFDFENFNFGNMIPVLILGGFISCVVIGITLLFVARSVFLKLKDYLYDNDGGDKK